MFHNNNLWHFFKNLFGDGVFDERRLVFADAPSQQGATGGESSGNNLDVNIGNSNPVSKEYKSEFEAVTFDWLKPSDKKLEKYSSFNEYLRRDIGNHIDAGKKIGIFLSDDKMPEEIREAYRNFVNSPDKPTARTQTINDLNTGKFKGFESIINAALELDNSVTQQNAKETFFSYFDTHAQNMADNAQGFVNGIETKAKSKFESLKSRFPTSVVADTLKNKLTTKIADLRGMYKSMPIELSATSLLDNTEHKKKIDNTYYEKLVGELRKRRIITQEESNKCFKRIKGKVINNFEEVNKLYSEGKIELEEFNEYMKVSREDSQTSFNLDEAIKLVNKLENEDPQRKGFKDGDVKLKVYSDVIGNHVQEEYNAFFKKTENLEKEIDYILSQYDEILEITQSGEEITSDDVANFISTFPGISTEEAKVIVEKIKSSLDNGFDDAIKYVNELGPQYGLKPGETSSIISKISDGKSISKDDPLFWTILFNDILSISNAMYEKEVSGEQEDQGGEDSKKKKDNPLQDLREKSADDINKIYEGADNSLFDSGDKKGLFTSVKSLLEEKRNNGSLPADQYNQELGYIKMAEEKSKELHNRHKSLYSQYNDPKKDTKFKRNTERKIQVNALNPYMIQKELENFRTELFPVGSSGKILVWVSLSSLSQAWKNAKKYFDERIQSGAKMVGHELASGVAESLGFKQLAAAERGRALSEFSSRVEEWKKVLKPFTKTQTYDQLIKNINSPFRYGVEHLQAVLEILADKSGFRLNDRNIIKAINGQLKILSSAQVINEYEYLKMDMAGKEAYLRKISKPLFNDTSFFTKLIKQNDDKIENGVKETQREIDRLGPSATRRVDDIYKRYMQLGRGQEKGGKAIFDKYGHLILGKQVRFSTVQDVDPAIFEESLFYCIKEVVGDPREKFFYLIRGIASGLIAEERLSQFESRGLYGKAGFLNPLRGATLPDIKELDLILTNNGQDKNIIEGNLSTDDKKNILERTAFVIRKLSDKGGGNDRENRNVEYLQTKKDIDMDLWRDISGKLKYETVEKDLFKTGFGGQAKISEFAWANMIAGLSDEFYTFGKDYHTGEISSNMQKSQVNDLVETMKTFIAIDAAKVIGTRNREGEADTSKLGEGLLNKPARMTGSLGVGISVGDYATILRSIVKATLEKIEGGEGIYNKVYNVPSKGANDYFVPQQGGSESFSDEFNRIVSKASGQQALIEVVEEYQRKGWIPSVHDENNCKQKLPSKVN